LPGLGRHAGLEAAGLHARGHERGAAGVPLGQPLAAIAGVQRDVVGVLARQVEVEAHAGAGGTRIGLHTTALGHALLSELDPAEAAERLARRPLKALTPHTITDPATLQRALEATRKRGYAWVDGDGAEGVAAMAVAGRIGNQLLGLSITGPTDRLRKSRDDYEAALAEVKVRVFGASDGLPPKRRTPGAAAAAQPSKR
jgi:DNA-binding IclR family transcriptional regulator